MSATTRPFVHLHCHSHYSLLDGASPIGKLVGRAKELGMNGLALTDHGNLYGAVQFYQACKSAGINPILGYEAYVAPGRRQDRSRTPTKEASFHLTLLAMNQQGFQNLIHMASCAYTEGFYYKPRIDKPLLEEFSSGLICLSGCASSELSNHILAERREEGLECPVLAVPFDERPQSADAGLASRRKIAIREGGVAGAQPEHRLVG